MSRNWWLLFATMILSVWNAGIVWFTQIAVYPLWPLVGREQFHDYHLTWWHDMWPSFGPVILMLVCSVLLLWKAPAGVSKSLLWLGVLLQLTVHSLTAFFWAPVQAAMATDDGMSAILYHELMATHWFRVLFFLVYAGLMVWLVVCSLPTVAASKVPVFSNEVA
jgi:hypothetical protein